ncbi:MAG: hypothetical protein QF535_05420, partial [Anaerolineales bacterium]|nr:hypothetical protein [Anaerolineales bacterium]
SDGFTASAGSAGSQYVNDASYTYVAWNWKANGSGSANTNGDIDSTISANTDAKFSVVAYTGTGGEPKTVAHGLGVSPEMVIIKKRNNTANWVVWHKDLADNYAFEGLNTTGAAVSGGSPISKYVDAVSSTLVTLGDAGENNASGDTYIMYCWASVDGYSKVGSYTGNGNADGTFVYTGFRPAWVMIKNTAASGSWYMYDTTRSPTENIMKNNLIFVKQYPTYPNRVYNEVAGLTLSIWYYKNEKCELEPIGPREIITPGRSASFTETWWLLPYPYPEDGSEVDLADVENRVNKLR